MDELIHLFFSACRVGFAVVCSAQGAEGSEARYLSELAEVTRGPASGEGLQSLLTDDDELDVDEELSGGDNDNIIIHGMKTKDKKSKR